MRLIDGFCNKLAVHVIQQCSVDGIAVDILEGVKWQTCQPQGNSPQITNERILGVPLFAFEISLDKSSNASSFVLSSLQIPGKTDQRVARTHFATATELRYIPPRGTEHVIAKRTNLKHLLKQMPLDLTSRSHATL